MFALVDRNLLFGIQALHNDFITRDQLIAAMNGWLLAKERSLEDVLVEQGALTTGRRHVLDALLHEHVKQHGDAQQSLAAMSLVPSVRQALEALRDQDVDRTLAYVGADRRLEHGVMSVGESTSAGTRFRILRPHARGGLGEVYVASDRELNREVALKEIQEEHAHSPASRARFLLEAEVTGGLEHPGIVPVYGLGSYADGRPFYAMRFIRGDSLKQAIAAYHAGSSVNVASRSRAGGTYLGERLVEFRKLLQRFVDVCEAIAYAHSRGVLHRDLKPGNIMLGRFGETLVVDWGLAKTLDKEEAPVVPWSEPTQPDVAEPPLRPSSSGSAETVVGQAMGTPQFMSPEQAAGRLDLLGPASDVYSLGATLYNLLTGRPPFAGKDTVEILDGVRKGRFPAPRQVNSDVPAGLDAICLKAMALEREERYRSPRELSQDIEHWLADEPVGAWPEPWTVKTRRWVGRHRPLVASAVAVLVVATAALVAGTVLLSRANADLAAANVRIKEANDGTKTALLKATKANEDTRVAYGKLEWSEKEARELAIKESKARLLADAEKKQKEEQLKFSEALLYNSTIREAILHWSGNDFVAMRNALDETKRNLRGPEYGYLARQHAMRLRALGTHEGAVNCLALSADGKRLYSGESSSGDKTIKVWDLDLGEQVLNLRGHVSGVTSLALSVDGKRLYSGSRGEIKVWDLEAGTETLTLRGHTDFVLSLVLSGDGTRLFSASGDKTIKVWDLTAGKETPAETLRGHTERVWSLVLSGDGKRLFSGSGDNTIRVWDLETNKVTGTLVGHVNDVTSLRLSRDGKRLFSGSHDLTIKVWDVETGKELQTLRGHKADVMDLALSGDGTRLFSASSDKTIKVWDLAAGKETLTVRGHTDTVIALALSADGKRLFSGSWDKTINVWDLGVDKETLSLYGHKKSVSSLALTRDAKRLFSGGWDTTIKVWDMEAGKETQTLRGHTDKVNCLALSRDGKRLFSGSTDKTIKVWDLETGAAIRTLRGHTDRVSRLVVSEDGKRLYSASLDKTVMVWDLEGGKEPLTLRMNKGNAVSLALTRDGKRLFTGTADIEVWDLETGKRGVPLRGHKSAAMSLAPSVDGKWLFSGGLDKTIKVWNLETGKEALTLRGHAHYVTSLATSADGKRLFSASVDATIKVWDLEARKETLTLREHTSEVTSLALSNDGKRLFSASVDQSIKVWDLEAGEQP